MMSAVMLSLLNQCYINVLREQQDINRFMYSVGGFSRLTTYAVMFYRQRSVSYVSNTI